MPNQTSQIMQHHTTTTQSGWPINGMPNGPQACKHIQDAFLNNQAMMEGYQLIGGRVHSLYAMKTSSGPRYANATNIRRRDCALITIPRYFRS
jgi:hypothetical protein